jgi:uncharacterized integral membrane protein
MSESQPPVQVERRGRSGPSTAAIIRLGLIGVVALIVIVFILQNTEAVQFTFLFWDFTLALWVMFLITLLVGVLIGMLTSALLRHRRRQELRRRSRAL